MDKITSKALFDLTHYDHAALFENSAYPWLALHNLKKYLTQVVGNLHTHSIPEGVHLVDPETIYIGKGTILEPGCFIQGPCILGDSCTVRHGAYIRGYLLAGNHCVIGHTTEVKESIFLNHACAAHFAYIGNSILGNHVNLGAGTKCANLKFDHSTIKVRLEDLVLDTGLRKLGAILGDGTQLGCNAVTNPGTITGKGVYWSPCLNTGGFIPPNSSVRPSSQAVIRQRS